MATRFEAPPFAAAADPTGDSYPHPPNADIDVRGVPSHFSGVGGARNYFLWQYESRLDAQWRELAFHEAGHATLGWALGCNPSKVTTIPWSTSCNGRTSFEPRLTTYHPHALAIGLAGVVAEGLHLGRFVALTGGDAEIVSKAAAIKSAAADSPNAELIEGRCRAAVRTWMLLPENRAFICELATAILEKRTLSGDDVADVLEDLPTTMSSMP